ncbi:hypothetical protein [Orrella marina]|nr:hypothetical protein [Orrella marina]
MATRHVTFMNAGNRTQPEGTVKRIMILPRRIVNETVTEPPHG